MEELLITHTIRSVINARLDIYIETVT